MHLRNNKKAFTLAEVLVTLAVIGVVAALTIPSIVKSTNKQQQATKAKAAFSLLSRATLQLKANNNGAMQGNCFDTDSEKAFNCYKEIFPIIKECGSGQGCFTNANIKGLKGDDTGFNQDTDTDTYKAILKNGVSIGFVDYPGDCNVTTGIGPLTQTCGAITIDLDGPNKGENKFGRDIFGMFIAERELVPAGSCHITVPSLAGTGCDYTVSCNADADASGGGCLGRILTEGTVNY